MIAPFRNKKITVVGDSIIDIYVYGSAIGKSAETPTIVAKKDHEEISLGGAFLLVRNLLAIGAIVDFVTLVGSDSESSIIDTFSHPNLRTFVIREPGRKTTSKKRYWIDGYKLLQFDEFDNTVIKNDTYKDAESLVRSSLLETELLLVSDYRHGLMSEDLSKFCLDESKRQHKDIYIDSQVSQSSSNHNDYKGATLFVLNEKEAMGILDTDHLLDIVVALRDISKILNSQKIVIKLGKRGSMSLINESIITTKALECESFDTCGAGDAFFAMLSMGDLTEAEKSLTLANHWAGLSTTKLGAHPPDIKDFLRRGLHE